MSAIRDIPEVAGLDGYGNLVRIPPEQDVPLTGRIRAIIDTASFRRLAKVSQTGLVSLVYPAAHHSRFEHSLGVYRMALLFLQRLSHDPRFAQAVTARDAEVFLLAALLHDLTGGFDLRATLGRLAAPLRRPRRLRRESAGAWLAALLVAMALPLTALSYQRYYLTYDDHAAERVAALLNERVGPDELIETYESELHFFLDRPYHYPPDQVHVELNRRSLLRQHVAIDYDPLAADPDYLVVGQFARGNGLYEPVLASGAFELMLRDGSYEVYRRVRR